MKLARLSILLVAFVILGGEPAAQALKEYCIYQVIQCSDHRSFCCYSPEDCSAKCEEYCWRHDLGCSFTS